MTLIIILLVAAIVYLWTKNRQLTSNTESLKAQATKAIRTAEDTKISLSKEFDEYRTKLTHKIRTEIDQQSRETTEREIQRLQQQSRESIEREIQRFRTNEISNIQITALRDAELRFNEWKATSIQFEREDAIKRSKAINLGFITEQVAPYLAGFNYNPKDVRFIGKPIDFVVFNGMHNDDIKEIVFVELKTGQSQPTTRERAVKRVIDAGLVRYELFRPNLGDVVTEAEMEEINELTTID